MRRWTQFTFSHRVVEGEIIASLCVLCSPRIIKLYQAHNIFPVIRDNGNKTVGKHPIQARDIIKQIHIRRICDWRYINSQSNSKLTSDFWEYWKISCFWQIESETLEVRQIFAWEHYFVLFVKRKQRVTAKSIFFFPESYLHPKWHFQKSTFMSY